MRRFCRLSGGPHIVLVEEAAMLSRLKQNPCQLLKVMRHEAYESFSR